MRRGAGGLLAVALAAAACAAAPVRPTEPGAPLVAPDTAGLRAELLREMEGFAGVAGVSLRDLATGASLSIRGEEPFPSASLIKVHVLVALLEEVHAGRVALDEPLTMIARDRVGGAGVLRHMGSGHRLSVEDAAWLMITISDNTATNLLLDKLDVRTVWTRMEALGLPRSKIHSKTFRRETSVAMDSSVLYGLGVTTPDETVELLTLLHAGRAVSPELDSLALAMMHANADPLMLRRWLPPGVRLANKTGSVSRSRNDCGIAYLPRAPVAVCVMTRENADESYGPDAEPHLLIARLGRVVFRHWGADIPAHAGAAESPANAAPAVIPAHEGAAVIPVNAGLQR